MENNKKNLEKIEDYLLGHLDEKEHTSFRREIEQDESLAEAVASQEKIRRGMIVGGRRALKAELKNIHREVVTEKQTTASVKKLNWRPLLAAASILFLGIISWWLWMSPTNTSTQIFADNYQPFNLVLNQRSDADNNQIPKAVMLYRSGKFQEAIPILENLIKEDNKNSQLLLALAISRFETGEAKDAFLPLSQIIAANDPFLTDLARWYTALFYIHLKQKDKALPPLQILADTPGADKGEEAKKILILLK